MSLITLVLAEIYIVIYGGKLLSFVAFLKVFGLILLSVLSNSAFIYFIVSFFKSNNAFATASTIIGTLIGFLTGIYIPIGQLPSGVQFIVKFFPPSYSTVLFRKVMMEKPIDMIFGNLPAGSSTDFEKTFGIVFNFGDYIVEDWLSILIMVMIAIIFFGLSILRLNKKNK
jgi:multidrug/hemolysin transport system permease protein